MQEKKIEEKTTLCHKKYVLVKCCLDAGCVIIEEFDGR
jgi:hypothetical protein